MHVDYLNSPKQFIITYIPNTVTTTRQLTPEKNHYFDSIIKNIVGDNKLIKLEDAGQINFDTAGVVFGAQGVTKAQAANFEYQVLQDGITTIIPWTSFTQFTDPAWPVISPQNDHEMGYIGKFSVGFGHCVTAELRNKHTDSIVSSSTVLWQKTQPTILGVFTAADLNNFLTAFKHQSQQEIYTLPIPIKSKKKDSLLVLKNSFTATDNSLIFYLDDKVRSKEFIEYSLTGPQGTDDWKSNDFDFNFIWLKSLPPGKYVLHVRFSVQRQNVTDYPFEIKPAWYQSATFKIIAGGLITAFFAFIFMLFRLRAKQQKLLAAELKNAKTEIKLKTIRAQLNPHFIFNALSSIQGLINKKDIPAANKYLGDFADLLREGLHAKDIEYISIEQEIKLLDTYLQLEQLRFNFTYSINAEPSLPLFETNIPALLLQPMAENAVKHGVAVLQNKGAIKIFFAQEGKNLVVSIEDNGGGFDTKQKTKGFGISLTQERIALLNDVNNGRRIELKIDSTSTGTKVYLFFKNWL